jgi:hypothetical protein
MCSDKTAPYSKCLAFTAPTELNITKDEAPAEKSCKKTICEAPANIIIDIPIVVIGDKPRSIASTPNIIPKGTTGIIKGLTSVTPFKNILNLLLILKIVFIRNKLYDQY